LDKNLKNKSIVLPARHRGDPELSDSVLLIPSPWECKLAVDYFGLKKENASLIDFASHYSLFDHQKKVSLVGPCLGAPAAVMIFEKLALLGAKKIFILGCCGSLQENIRIGDMIIPEKAIRDEGTSFHYAEENFVPKAGRKIIGLVSKACKEEGIPYKKGKVWTTDAPYRETAEKVRKLQKENILGVDMELSALFTVAHLKRIELGGLLIVSDELSSLTWKKGFHTEKFKSSFDKGCDIALKVFDRL
jgi:purine-nucleoside phosphorylase